MDFRLTDEQELLLESVDQFIDQCIEKGYNEDYWRRAWEENRYPLEYFKELMESGLGLIGVPEQFGGSEVDLVTMCLVDERFSSRGFYSAIETAMQIDDMASFGSPEQIELVSKQIMTGKGGFSLGFTEPGAGSDSNAMATTATYRGDGTVVINGSKCFVTNADVSEYLLLVCREAEPEDPKYWASMYFVPSNSEGIKLTPMHKLGVKTEGSLCEVRLDDVVVPESALVGTRGHGFVQLMKNFEMERLTASCRVMGMAQNAMDIAAAYAGERIAFGQPIGNFQLVQEMLVENEIKLQNMRNMIFRTAWEKDNGMSIRTAASLVKYYCARAGFEVADNCMQIMGGIGYTDECPISRLWRDLRLFRIGGGTDQIQIHIAGRQLVKKYKRK